MLNVIDTPASPAALTLSRVALVAQLERAKHVVPARCTKPILAGIHLEAWDGWLRIRATDGSVTLFTQTPVEGLLSACVVPLAELLRRLKASKETTCSLALSGKGDQLQLNGGRVAHVLETYPVADFPEVRTGYAGSTVTVDAAELITAWRTIAPAVAKEPSRYAIDGVLLECDAQGTRLAATDGHRLAMVSLRAVETEFAGRVIQPARLFRLIEKLTDKEMDYLVLAIDRGKDAGGAELPGRLFAAGPDWLLTAEEPEGRFPHYQDVVPASHSKFAVARVALIESLTEVALATSDEARCVCVDLLPNELRLTANAPGIGQSQAALPTRFLGGGDREIHTAFNPVFLLDALKALTGETVVIDVDQNGYGCDHKVYGKPALLYAEHDSHTRWVIMPVNAELPATRANLGRNYRKSLANAG